MTPGTDGSASGLDRLRGDLKHAIAVHLPYAFVSALVVCCSVVAGTLSQSMGSGRLARLPFTALASSTLSQDQPVLALLRADTELLSVLVVGAVTLGLATALGLVAVGVVVGIFFGSSIGTISPGLAVVAVAPHGLVKLLGVALAAGVSFRLVARGLAVLVGYHGRYLDNREWRQAGLVLALSWLTLACAAVIESVVTVRLVELLA
jgi:hypothetical protein